MRRREENKELARGTSEKPSQSQSRSKEAQESRLSMQEGTQSRLPFSYGTQLRGMPQDSPHSYLNEPTRLRVNEEAGLPVHSSIDQTFPQQPPSFSNITMPIRSSFMQPLQQLSSRLPVSSYSSPPQQQQQQQQPQQQQPPFSQYQRRETTLESRPVGKSEKDQGPGTKKVTIVGDLWSSKSKSKR